MAGSDTFRGASFQTAYATGLALDALEGRVEALAVEGDEDVVDAAPEASGGEALLSVQAKTKVEPYVWTPQAIPDVVARSPRDRPEG